MAALRSYCLKGISKPIIRDPIRIQTHIDWIHSQGSQQQDASTSTLVSTLSASSVLPPPNTSSMKDGSQIAPLFCLKQGSIQSLPTACRIRSELRTVAYGRPWHDLTKTKLIPGHTRALCTRHIRTSFQYLKQGKLFLKYKPSHGLLPLLRKYLDSLPRAYVSSFASRPSRWLGLSSSHFSSFVSYSLPSQHSHNFQFCVHIFTHLHQIALHELQQPATKAIEQNSEDTKTMSG